MNRLPRRADKRTRRQNRAPLAESERQQLARLGASLGPLVAARTVGLDFETFKAAVAGNAINPSTAERIRSSGWLHRT
jgi:hypothetical protein